MSSYYVNKIPVSQFEYWDVKRKLSLTKKKFVEKIHSTYLVLLCDTGDLIEIL